MTIRGSSPSTLRTTIRSTKRAKGAGTLIRRGTKSDPRYTRSPLVSIGEFIYVSGVAEYTVTNEKPLRVGNGYLPYLHGRHYDGLRLFNVGARFDQAEYERDETFAVQRLTSS